MKQSKKFLWGYHEAPLLKKIVPKNKKGNALDLGCGCGGNSLWLAKSGFQVLAVDKNLELIDCFKKRINKSKHKKKIKIVKSEIEHFVWPKGKLDFILAVSVLHFLSLKDATRVIVQIKKSFNNEGVVFIRIFSNKNGGNFPYLPTEKDFKKQFNALRTIYFKHYFVKDKEGHGHWVMDLVAKK